MFDGHINRTAAPPIRLGPPINPNALSSIERQLHLQFDKWDTQVGDISVLCEHPVILPSGEWDSICACAENLAAETERLESLALETPHQLSTMGIPPTMREALRRGFQSPATNALRSMRFDFHPTASGWRVTEANTDVPGGWREGASLPDLYQPFYTSLDCPESPLEAWGNGIETLAPTGQVVLLSASGYLEDQQVLRAFRSELMSRRIAASLIQTPAALDWTRAGCCKLAGSHLPVSAIVRFYQLEWMCALPAGAGWRELLTNREIPVLNPVISAISENKRFALLFRETQACPGWRALMPECRDPREVGGTEWDEWVLKACYSSTGEQVIMVGDLPSRERQRVIRKFQRHPLQWVAQRRFSTLGLESCRGPVFPCVGVFVVGGRAAGAYVRLSTHQVTDCAALEAPLLIDRGR